MRHKTCGTIWDIKPTNFLSKNNRCPKCSKCKPETIKIIKDFNKLIDNKTRGEFIIMNEYINNFIEVQIKHDLCGHCWSELPLIFLNKLKCPICDSHRSSGELRIRSFLELNYILFEEQYGFENCKDNNILRFDFAIFNNNFDVQYLIEYDGIQHFKAIEYFGGKKAFEKSQYHDQLKNEYCEKHNIPLLRIPYWEFNNIEKILTNYFKL